MHGAQINWMLTGLPHQSLVSDHRTFKDILDFINSTGTLSMQKQAGGTPVPTLSTVTLISDQGAMVPPASQQTAHCLLLRFPFCSRIIAA